MTIYSIPRLTYERALYLKVSYDSILGWMLEEHEGNCKLAITESKALQIIATLKRMRQGPKGELP